MANLKVYYYDPEKDNLFSGSGESYTLPPYATPTPPKQKPADEQFRYDYHFNEKTEKWQERKVPLIAPTPEPESTETT